MECDLSGRTAFVTGAANGIGRAIAQRLSQNGAAVVIADVDMANAEALASTLPQAFACQVDIRDEAAIEAAMAATEARFGGLDILVNNAGVNTLAHRVNINAFPLEEWDRITSVDLDGLFPGQPTRAEAHAGVRPAAAASSTSPRS